MVRRTETQDEGRLFRVRVCRMADSERLPLVVGPDHLPVPTPNQWMLNDPNLKIGQAYAVNPDGPNSGEPTDEGVVAMQ